MRLSVVSLLLLLACSNELHVFSLATTAPISRGRMVAASDGNGDQSLVLVGSSHSSNQMENRTETVIFDTYDALRFGTNFALLHVVLHGVFDIACPLAMLWFAQYRLKEKEQSKDQLATTSISDPLRVTNGRVSPKVLYALAAIIVLGAIAAALLFRFLIFEDDSNHSQTKSYTTLGISALVIISIILVGSAMLFIPFWKSSVEVPNRALSRVMSVLLSYSLISSLIIMAVLGMVLGEWNPGIADKEGDGGLSISASMDYLPGAVVATFAIAAPAAFLPFTEVLYGISKGKNSTSHTTPRQAKTNEIVSTVMLFVRVVLATGLCVGFFATVLSPMDWSANTIGKVSPATRAKWAKYHYPFAYFTFGCLFFICFAILFDMRHNLSRVSFIAIIIGVVAALVLFGVSNQFPLLFAVAEYVICFVFASLLPLRFSDVDSDATSRVIQHLVAEWLAKSVAAEGETLPTPTEENEIGMGATLLLLPSLVPAGLYTVGTVVISTIILYLDHDGGGGCTREGCALSIVVLLIAALFPLTLAFLGRTTEWLKLTPSSLVGLMLSCASALYALVAVLSGYRSRGAALIMSIGISIMPILLFLLSGLFVSLMGFFDHNKFFKGKTSIIGASMRFSTGRAGMWMLAVVLSFLPVIETVAASSSEGSLMRMARVALSVMVTVTYSLQLALLDATQSPTAPAWVSNAQLVVGLVTLFVWVAYTAVVSSNLLGTNNAMREKDKMRLEASVVMSSVAAATLATVTVLGREKPALTTQPWFSELRFLSEGLMFLSLPFAMLSRFTTEDILSLQRALAVIFKIATTA